MMKEKPAVYRVLKQQVRKQSMQGVPGESNDSTRRHPPESQRRRFTTMARGATCCSFPQEHACYDSCGDSRCQLFGIKDFGILGEVPEGWLLFDHAPARKSPCVAGVDKPAEDTLDTQGTPEGSGFERRETG
jgi:hypothetical protein